MAQRQCICEACGSEFTVKQNDPPVPYVCDECMVPFLYICPEQECVEEMEENLEFCMGDERQGNKHQTDIPPCPDVECHCHCPACGHMFSTPTSHCPNCRAAFQYHCPTNGNPIPTPDAFPLDPCSECHTKHDCICPDLQIIV